MLELKKYAIPDDINSAEKLIEFLVRENVRAFNSKQGSDAGGDNDVPLFKYLSQAELDDGVYTGKIGFGGKKNEAAQDEEEAVKNALQCFEDGIYRVLVNDTELGAKRESSQTAAGIALKEGDALTFIRLVMLAGRRF
jgi:hypothetical protein